MVINPSPRLLILDRLEITRRNMVKPGAFFSEPVITGTHILLTWGRKTSPTCAPPPGVATELTRRCTCPRRPERAKGDSVPRLEAPINGATRRLDVSGFVGLLLKLLVRVMRRPRAGLCHDHFTLGKEVKKNVLIQRWRPASRDKERKQDQTTGIPWSLTRWSLKIQHEKSRLI